MGQFMWLGVWSDPCCDSGQTMDSPTIGLVAGAMGSAEGAGGNVGLSKFGQTFDGGIVGQVAMGAIGSSVNSL